MSDDTIYRKDAIKALNREKSDWNCDYNVPIDNCIKRLNKVKSADRPQGEWIDAEYCEDFFDRWESRVKNADPVIIDVVQNTRTLLRDAPSIDIVRCVECKWSEPTNDGWNSVTCNFQGETTLTMPTDGFCNYGERKTNAD